MIGNFGRQFLIQIKKMPFAAIDRALGPSGGGACRRAMGALHTDLSQCGAAADPQHGAMWHPITTAPSDRDIELAVLDLDGSHALVFPCRRIAAGWMNVQNGERLDVRPTHWREWTDGAAGPASGRR